MLYCPFDLISLMHDVTMKIAVLMLTCVDFSAFCVFKKESLCYKRHKMTFISSEGDTCLTFTI